MEFPQLFRSSEFTRICKSPRTASRTAGPGFHQCCSVCKVSVQPKQKCEEATETGEININLHVCFTTQPHHFISELHYSSEGFCACSQRVVSRHSRTLGSAVFCRLRPLWETLSDRMGQGWWKFFLGHSQPFPEISGFYSSTVGSRSSSSPTGRAGPAVFTPRVIVSFLPETPHLKKE